VKPLSAVNPNKEQALKERKQQNGEQLWKNPKYRENSRRDTTQFAKNNQLVMTAALHPEYRKSYR
jgi:hypothetical protein